MHIFLSVIFLTLLASVGIGMMALTLLHDILTRLKAMATPTVTLSTSTLKKAAATNTEFAEQARRTIAANRKRKTT